MRTAMIRPAVTVLLYPIRVARKEVERRIKRIRTARADVGIVPSSLLFVVAFLSFPPGFAHEVWKSGWQRIGSERTAIELWVVLWLLLQVIFLLLMESVCIWVGWLFAVLLTFRLLDQFYTLFFLLLAWQAPQSAPRSLILLLIHYLEIVLIFAPIYLLLQRLVDSTIFYVHGEPGRLTAFQAFHYSLITATTVGYGDITPNTSALGLLWWNWIEPFVAGFIIVMDIPRVIALSGPQRHP